MIASAPLEIQTWQIDRLVLYARNPRKNDSLVDRMCSSIREFGFKIPVLARSDGAIGGIHGWSSGGPLEAADLNQSGRTSGDQATSPDPRS